MVCMTPVEAVMECDGETYLDESDYKLLKCKKMFAV